MTEEVKILREEILSHPDARIEDRSYNNYRSTAVLYKGERMGIVLTCVPGDYEKHLPEVLRHSLKRIRAGGAEPRGREKSVPDGRKD